MKRAFAALPAWPWKKKQAATEGEPGSGHLASDPVVIRVGAVDPHHIHTGLEQLREHRLVPGSGPQGGDEVNVIRAGTNYGWPVITYGVNYVIGTAIGEGTHKEGMAQPLHYWDPSIAPSGMAFYDAGRFPRWRGNLLVGALKHRSLVRLELDGERVVHEERLLEDELGRIRDVRVGPDGFVYLITDAADGVIARLEPTDG